ncbi:MAG: SIS domain-containing protein [Anaerolineae bacterium]|nr:SIS domain-containing protein [Anaerolineae bacterium]
MTQQKPFSTGSHLEREIFEQPQVIKRLVTERRDGVAAIAADIRAANPCYVAIAARGTSDHAALYGKYLFGVWANLPVALATPSVFTLYDSPPLLKDALVIGISQSGRSTDVGQVLTAAAGQGALTLAITNDETSPMAQTAKYHIPLSAGQELSLAATKTYTAQLTTLAMLVAALVDHQEMADGLEKLPGWVDETLQMSEGVVARAERYAFMEHCVTLGRGYNYATCFEIALKIKELTYVVAQPYSSADFRHGPIAVVGAGFPALVVATRGKVYDDMIDLLKALKERSAELIVISDSAEALNFARSPFCLPSDVPEWISPVVSVLPGQLFAMGLALAKGHNIDNPRGLHKITITY